MENKKDFIEQFSSLKDIEPSDEWNKKLFERINASKHRAYSDYGSPALLLSLSVLLVLNIYSFSKSIVSDNKQQSQSKLKYIASEFLINTSSSKY